MQSQICFWIHLRALFTLQQYKDKVLFYSEKLVWGTLMNKQIQFVVVVLVALTLLPALNLSLSSVNAANTQSSWIVMKPMPTARGEFGVAVVNGKIYAIGGLNGDNLPVSAVEEQILQRFQYGAPNTTPPRTTSADSDYLSESLFDVK